MNDPLLDNLNSQQRIAVEATEGPLLILAGAGSGKTRVITHRIAFLVDRIGIPLHNILAVTFTNKAAQEMRERVESLLRRDIGYGSLGTFHAICARVLRHHIDLMGYSTSFSIYDSGDQLSLMKRVVKDLEINAERFAPAMLLATVSRFKQDMIEPGDVALEGQNIFTNIAAKVYATYQEKLKAANALDFDDLLNFTVKLFRSEEDIRMQYGQNWQYILVDEYQDTNKAQYLFLRLLTQSHDNLCVVGDDDQSIYRWRGANLKNILSFEKDFPSAKVVKLEQNYRSTETILNVAHNVISRNVGRKAKKLWTKENPGDKVTVYAAETESREAQFVADEISRRVGEGEYRYSDFAVFYRTNAQSRPIESQFALGKIPYTIVGGLKFYERKEIKDALAYLRVIINPADDVNFLRIINVPTRGIGAVTIAKIRAVAMERRVTLWEAANIALRKKMLSLAPSGKISDFIELLETLRGMSETMPLEELVPQLLEKSGYWEMLNRDGSDEAKDRIANLNELVNEVAEFSRQMGEESSVESFLEQTALASDIDEYQDDRDQVVLMTVHSAKGLEFPIVFLTGMEEQLFPHSRSMDSDDDIEEERRLAYVGITRARKRLLICFARSRMVFGQTRTTLPSRFLNDISPSYIEDRTGVQKRMGTRGRFHFDGDGAYSQEQFDDQESSGEYIDYEPTYDADSGEMTSVIQPRMKVYHPSFGVGKVAAVSGKGDQAKATVLFPGAPLKKILCKFLQPVS